MSSSFFFWPLTSSVCVCDVSMSAGRYKMQTRVERRKSDRCESYHDDMAVDGEHLVMDLV